MIICPVNIQLFITVNTLVKNINLEFYFCIYMYGCLHIPRYGYTQGVCVFGWEQVCVHICIYVGMCVDGYMSTGAVAIASVRRLKDKLSCQFLTSYCDMMTFL